MREILFRGKRLDNGEWIEGDLLRGKLKQQLGKFYIDPYGYLLPIVEVIPETIGQYTGLPDKNGEMIFEGDIVHSDETNTNYIVKYNSKDVAWNAKSLVSLSTYYFRSILGCVVIGNIYDTVTVEESIQELSEVKE